MLVGLPIAKSLHFWLKEITEDVNQYQVETPCKWILNWNTHGESVTCIVKINTFGLYSAKILDLKVIFNFFVEV